MNCQLYEIYEQGEMTEQLFAQHLQSCETCRQTLRREKRLLAAAESLKERVSVPGLWGRIEVEMLEQQVPVQRKFNRKFHLLWAASMVLAAVAIGVFIGVFLERTGSGVLSRSALSKVRQTEQKYITAIAQLEQKVKLQIKKTDIQLILLYKQRLVIIDSQIREYREALQHNPANSHIRRYMLAALQDKKETLTELIRPNRGKK